MSFYTSAQRNGESWAQPLPQYVAPKAETLTFTRLNNDVNGNPRYAVHFLALNTRAELDAEPWIDVSAKYALAVKRANSIGGRKYHCRAYGGGIVFQSYSIDETAAHISRVTGRNFKAEQQ